MTAYVDTSALVAVAFGEPVARAVVRRLRRHELLISNALAEAELLASLRREGRPLDLADALLAPISLVFPDSSLGIQCREALTVGALRGADLWHVATALSVAGSSGRRELEFMSFDRAQAGVAQKLGFAVWPRY